MWYAIPVRWPGFDVPDRQLDVVVGRAREVEVSPHRVETELAAARLGRQRVDEIGRRVLVDEAARHVGAAARSGARVDVGPQFLAEAEEDRVVVRAGGSDRVVRPVVDREPLAVDARRLHAEAVSAPGVAVVVADRAVELDQGLEVGEVGVALVVGDDVRVTAARACVGPGSDRAVDVELVAAVGRAVDEGLLRRDPPRPALPVGAVVRIEPVDGLALGSLPVDDGRRRREDEAAGTTRRNGSPARLGDEGRGAVVGRGGGQERHDPHLVGALVAVRVLEQESLGGRPSRGGLPDEIARVVVDEEVEVVVRAAPRDLDVGATRVRRPVARRDVHGELEVVAADVAGVGRRRTDVRDRRRHGVGPARPSSGHSRRPDRPRRRCRRGKCPGSDEQEPAEKHEPREASEDLHLCPPWEIKKKTGGAYPLAGKTKHRLFVSVSESEKWLSVRIWRTNPTPDEF